jgi:type IV secretion system protein TrbL
MVSLKTLQDMIDSMETTLSSGGPALYSVLMGYLGFFLLLTLVMTAYGCIAHGRVLTGALSVLMRLSLVYWALGIWPWLLAEIRDLGVFLGLLVTGGQLTVTDFLDPGALLQTGFKSGAVLWDAYRAHNGYTQIFTAFPLLLAWAAYTAAFAVIAFKVFWWQVELLIVSVAGMCLLPCLMLRQTAFVAQGVLSYAANCFARFLLGAMLAGLMWRHLDIFAVSPALSQKVGLDAQVQAAMMATGLAWVLAACFLAVNRLAGTLTSGIPGMAGGQSLGSVGRMLATGGTAAAMVGGAAVTGGLGAAGGARAGVHALAGLHSGSLGSLKEAARATYAGVQQGAHGQNLGRLTTLMRGADPTKMVERTAQVTLGQLMQAGRTPHDQTHGGARHH